MRCSLQNTVSPAQDLAACQGHHLLPYDLANLQTSRGLKLPLPGVVCA